MISLLMFPFKVSIPHMPYLSFFIQQNVILLLLSFNLLFCLPISARPLDANRLPIPQDWQYPGGQATSTKIFNKNAFSQSSANLPFEQELDFKVGNGLFKRLWVKAPASTQASDGLGPLYNARACQRCHIKDGRGHVPTANFPQDSAVSMFLRLSIPPQTEAQRQALAAGHLAVIPDPTYGTQLQDFALLPALPEGQMHITYKESITYLADGTAVTLRAPSYRIEALNYGPPHPDLLISPRVAPPMIGLGLLENIAAQDILSYADPEDLNQDGISGRPNQVWDSVQKKVTLGRFGWKAGQPNLKQQAAHAFAGDIGLSNPLVPKAAGDCMPSQTLCHKMPTGNSPQYDNLEVPDKVLELVTFYTQHLAVPARRESQKADVQLGYHLFKQAGCHLCHVESYTTRQDSTDKSLAGQKIWPYTDLLLHDMGPGLADNRPEARASGQEWRTPPLWGLGLTQEVNKHMQLLHDGRARGVLEAILWHGGEADTAKQFVMNLPADQRRALITFLEAL